jgi:hypothetical protein
MIPLVLGVLLPLYYASAAQKTDGASHQQMANSDGFRILRTFAAGIMLGENYKSSIRISRY